MVLETPRLLLREFREEDWRASNRFEADPEVMRYQLNNVRNGTESLHYILQILEEAQEEPRVVYDLAIVEKKSHQLIGRIGIRIEYDAEEASLWYLLNRAYWRKGYTSEAALAMLRFGFEDLHLHRIWADCDPRNTGSYKVMEKIGMRREAHFRQNIMIKDEWCDSYVYAILEDEWRENKSKISN